MTLTRGNRPDFWSLAPFRRAANLGQEVDELLRFALGRFAGSEGATNAQASQWVDSWFPVIDIFEDKDSVQVKAELPGLKKEDIVISLQNGYLTLSGERKKEEKYEGAEVHRVERWVGRFYRSIGLPCRVNPENINATYNDGVLTVSLAKAEEAKPKQIQVTVK